jgi:hypothetical protein
MHDNSSLIIEIYDYLDASVDANLDYDMSADACLAISSALMPYFAKSIS